jgi:phosphomannomutase
LRVPPPTSARRAGSTTLPGYIEFCKSTFRTSGTKGWRIVVDRAHGAGYAVAAGLHELAPK